MLNSEMYKAAFEQMAAKMKHNHGEVIAIEFAVVTYRASDGSVRTVLQPAQAQDRKRRWIPFMVGSWGMFGGGSYEVDINKLKEELKNGTAEKASSC